jgi:predicted metal-dependent phosphoesterase TrpH
LQVDLHSHTNASDGRLSPVELCERAIQHGVTLLAITDHDTVIGARAATEWLRATTAQLHVVPAVEYSSVWSHMGVHLVGLGIDLEHPTTLSASEFFAEARMKRAEMIGARLAKLKMPDAFEGALALAGDAQIGRPHFARYLVAKGHVRSEEDAFDRYLGAGKPGDIKMLWPELGQVVDWIRAAGGVAVLAHPSKYRQTGARLRKLVAEFAACGGGAIEVVVGRQVADESRFLAQLCRQHNLEASVGSDFHAPSNWCELGEINALPEGCTPVWQRWMN